MSAADKLSPVQFSGRESPRDVRYNGVLQNRWGVQRGNLDTWYHGMAGPDRELTNHDPGKGEHWNIGLGTHFAENPRLAEDFSKGESGKEKGTVVAARLKAERPIVYGSEYDMDRDAFQQERARGTDFGGYNGLGNVSTPFHMAALSNHPDARGIARRFKENLQKQGYDSVIYRNEIEGNRRGRNAIVFEPSQIDRTSRGKELGQ
jgi:ADP-Ribosyltransferase in polyvalent proteins